MAVLPPPPGPQQVDVFDLGLQFRPRIGTRVVSGAAMIPQVAETRIDRFTFNDNQVKALNSLPVVIIPAVPNVYLMPIRALWIGLAGTAYSGTVGPLIEYTDGSNSAGLDANAWDGSALAESSISNVSSWMTEGNRVDITGLVGLGLQITSGADVTGGPSSMSLILEWEIYFGVPQAIIL